MRSRFRQNSRKSRISSRVSTSANKRRWEMINHPRVLVLDSDNQDSLKKRKKKENKASWPTMRPQACMIIICVTFWVFHGWLIISQRFWLAGVEIREKMRNFQLFWRKRNGRTDGPTNGRTDGPTDRPSYRDVRSHLKTVGDIWIYKSQFANGCFCERFAASCKGWMRARRSPERVK